MRRLLGILFESEFAGSLVFKGGTSLSKVFGVAAGQLLEQHNGFRAKLLRAHFERARHDVPIPSLGGSLARPRPIIAACVIGPTGSKFIDGLLDTGSDDTVLEEWVAALVGVDLTQKRAKVREQCNAT